MKLIRRFIALKMSILRVDAAIINPKTVKPNLYPSRIIVGTDMEDDRLVQVAHTFAELLHHIHLLTEYSSPIYFRFLNRQSNP